MKKHPDCVDECMVAAARGPLRICTDKCAYADDEIHESPADNPRVTLQQDIDKILHHMIQFPDDDQP